LRVRPGARIAAVVGAHGDRLKVSINAPPVDGKANDALLHLLAGWLRLPVRQLHLHSGASGRDKVVRIEATNAEELTQRLLAVATAA